MAPLLWLLRIRISFIRQDERKIMDTTFEKSDSLIHLNNTVDVDKLTERDGEHADSEVSM